MDNPKIGIRPIVDGRRADRHNLEKKVLEMAGQAQKLIEREVRCADGSYAQCVMAATAIGGSTEAAARRRRPARKNSPGAAWSQL